MFGSFASDLRLHGNDAFVLTSGYGFSLGLIGLNIFHLVLQDDVAILVTIVLTMTFMQTQSLWSGFARIYGYYSRDSRLKMEAETQFPQRPERDDIEGLDQYLERKREVARRILGYPEPREEHEPMYYEGLNKLARDSRFVSRLQSLGISTTVRDRYFSLSLQPSLSLFVPLIYREFCTFLHNFPHLILLPIKALGLLMSPTIIKFARWRAKGCLNREGFGGSRITDCYAVASARADGNEKEMREVFERFQRFKEQVGGKFAVTTSFLFSSRLGIFWASSKVESSPTFWNAHSGFFAGIYILPLLGMNEIAMLITTPFHFCAWTFQCIGLPRLDIGGPGCLYSTSLLLQGFVFLPIFFSFHVGMLAAIPYFIADHTNLLSFSDVLNSMWWILPALISWFTVWSASIDMILRVTKTYREFIPWQLLISASDAPCMLIRQYFILLARVSAWCYSVGLLGELMICFVFIFFCMWPIAIPFAVANLWILCIAVPITFCLTYQGTRVVRKNWSERPLWKAEMEELNNERLRQWELVQEKVRKSEKDHSDKLYYLCKRLLEIDIEEEVENKT
eukprot:g1455.t1